MAEKDIKIKDAPLVESVQGTEKLPCSDGSGQPKAVTVNQINKSVKADIASLAETVGGMFQSISDEFTRVKETEAQLSSSIWGEVNRAKMAEDELSGRISDVSTALTEEVSRATEAEQQNAEGIEANRLTIEEVKEMFYAFSAETFSVGFARENGSSDPAAEIYFGDEGKFNDIAVHFHLGTFGREGELVKKAKDGYLTVAEDGSTIAIDGSMGDVGVYTDVDIYKLCETFTIGGREMNVIAFSLQPFNWHGRKAKRITPFALSADGTVNAQIFDDVRKQSHCVYNKDAIGAYQAPSGIFKSTYYTSGGCHASNGTSCVASIQYAQAKNASATDNRPYISGYYEYFEMLVGMMMIGCKSTTHTQLTSFGCSVTQMDATNATTFNDEAISANSGFRVVKSDGTQLTTALMSAYVRVNAEATATKTLLSGVGMECSSCECLEAQRVLGGISKAGLTSYIGSKGNIFAMSDEGELTVITDGSVNVDDGTGMEVNKNYYIVRDVPGFRGLADGQMTAVVNAYTKFEFADGVVLHSNSEELAGAIAIMKRSIPVFLGWALPYKGYYIQTDGAFYVVKCDADNVESVEYRAASSVDNIPPRTSFSYQTALDGEADIEVGLDKRIDIGMVGSVANAVKASNYSMSLFCHAAVGGGIRAYESAFLWMYTDLNGGMNTRQVRGSVLGCYAIFSGHVSARAVDSNSHAGSGYRSVGSWSIPYPKF